MNDDDDEFLKPESMLDQRRKSWQHFHAKADNARMSAYVLSHINVDLAAELSKDISYGGSSDIALGEGFIREASIALELIVKAVLCIQNESAPPATHDVFDLWSQAQLPILSDDDYYRLARITQILYWSGRYAAPTTDRHLIRARERFEKYGRSEMLGSIKIYKITPLKWDDFNALYNIAHERLCAFQGNDDS